MAPTPSQFFLFLAYSSCPMRCRTDRTLGNWLSLARAACVRSTIVHLVVISIFSRMICTGSPQRQAASEISEIWMMPKGSGYYYYCCAVLFYLQTSRVSLDPRFAEELINVIGMTCRL